MNINRDNYEEYFILYADRELNAQQKQEVEQFVAANNDLLPEFKMFQMTVQSADEKIEFTQKNSLFKEADIFIDESNFEEKFILFYDGELNEEEKHSVNQFVLAHPQHAHEFNLYALTKIIPDKAVIFEKKHTLLKKETDGKVVPFIVWKILAAAMIAGAGIWFTANYFAPVKTLTPEITTASATKNIQPDPPTHAGENTVSPPNATTETKKEPDASYAINTQQAREKPAVKDAKEQAIPKNKKEPIEIIAHLAQKNTTLEDFKIKEPQIQIPKMIDDALAIAVNNKTPSVQIDKEIKPDGDPQNYALSTVNTRASNNENYVFYNVTNEEFNKTKVGGFLRKLKRIVERTNPIAKMLSGNEKQVASN